MKPIPFIVIGLLIGILFSLNYCNTKYEERISEQDNRIDSLYLEIETVSQQNQGLKDTVSGLKSEKVELVNTFSKEKQSLLKLSRASAISRVAKNTGADSILINPDSSFTLPPWIADSINLAYAQLDYLILDKSKSDSIILFQDEIIANDSIHIKALNQVDSIRQYQIKQSEKKASRYKIQRNIAIGASILMLGIIIF